MRCPTNFSLSRCAQASPPRDLNDKLKFVGHNIGHRIGGHSGAETKAERDARMAWRREARFGMFIHWALCRARGRVQRTALDAHRRMDHGMGQHPRAEYENVAPHQSPASSMLPIGWRIAKDAGMKYIVITSKHHDGFAMYDSAGEQVRASLMRLYRKDPIKALAAEARKQGLKFCFYYSILDWHHPSAYVDASPGKDPTAGIVSHFSTDEDKIHHILNIIPR